MKFLLVLESYKNHYNTVLIDCNSFTNFILIFHSFHKRYMREEGLYEDYLKES